MKDNLFEDMGKELLLSLKKQSNDEDGVDLSSGQLEEIWEAVRKTDQLLLTNADTETAPHKGKFNDLKEKIISILENKAK